MGIRALLYEDRDGRLAQGEALSASRTAGAWPEILRQFDAVGAGPDAKNGGFDGLVKRLGEAAKEARALEVERDVTQLDYRKEAKDVRILGEELNQWRAAFFGVLPGDPEDEAHADFSVWFEGFSDRGDLSPRAALAQAERIVKHVRRRGGIPEGMMLAPNHLAEGERLIAESTGGTAERGAAETQRMWLTSQVGKAYVRVNNLLVLVENALAQVERVTGVAVAGIHLGPLRAVRGRRGGPVMPDDLEDEVVPEPEDDRPGDGRPDVGSPLPVRPVEG